MLKVIQETSYRETTIKNYAIYLASKNTNREKAILPWAGKPCFKTQSITIQWESRQIH